MGWLWTLQLILDVALILVLWKLLTGRHSGQNSLDEPVETTLRREDFEQYHEAFSDLCDQLEREGERWVTRLEQKTRAASQMIQRLEDPDRSEARPVAPPQPREEEAAAPVVRGSERSSVREEVLYLRSQGYTVDQIARQLHLGQREVQLLLSLQQRSV